MMPLEPIPSAPEYGGRRGDVRATPADTARRTRERRAKRTTALRKQGYRSYREYLRSPHWLRLKRRYREADLPQVCICGEDEVHLHHLTYDRVGAEELTDLTPLCGRCHSLVHVLEYRGDLAIDLEGLCDEGRATEARALLRELAAQRQAEREQRRNDEQALVRALTVAGRLMRAVDHARSNRVDVTRETRLLRNMAGDGRSHKALTGQVARVEAKAYGWDEWDF